MEVKMVDGGSIERHIGETVADAVWAVWRGLMEYEDGGLHAETEMMASCVLAYLSELRLNTAGYVSFDDVARHHGKIVLRERFGSDVSEATLDELISVRWTYRQTLSENFYIEAGMIAGGLLHTLRI